MSPLSDEYQTPKKYIKAAKLVMGSIDLDAASSKINNQRLWIPNYCSIESSGLERDWFGNVWLNPPYSKPNLTLFTNYLLDQYRNFNQLTYLVPSYTSEKWYQKCLTLMSAFCLPNHRINHSIDGKIKDTPRFSSTFFYFGNNPIKFQEVFSQFGKCFLNK